MLRRPFGWDCRAAILLVFIIPQPATKLIADARSAPGGARPKRTITTLQLEQNAFEQQVAASPPE